MSSYKPLSWGRPLEPAAFRELRRELELSHYKWDAQVGDDVAIAPAPLLISRADWGRLAHLSRLLFTETVLLETELQERRELHAALGMPTALRRLFEAQVRLTPMAARVMRFDFHATSEGWRLSEVNSDVPGGYAEATHLTRLMAARRSDAVSPGDPTAALVSALVGAAKGGTVALTCAPGFMEDQQVVAHLAAAVRGQGGAAELASIEQLRWAGGRALLRVAGAATCEISAIFRFYQLEWLARLDSGGWRDLLVGAETPVTNPALAAFSESKRLPLLWGRLRTSTPTWQSLLPETRPLADAPWTTDDGWLIKSAYCNNGDTVAWRSAMSPLAWLKRCAEARLRPSQWLAQRRFEVVPVSDERGQAWLPCVGVYVVDGEVAGAYTRVTRRAFIDFAARDAALLIYDER